MLYRLHKSNLREDACWLLTNARWLLSFGTVQSLEHLEENEEVYNGVHPGNKSHVFFIGGVDQAESSVGFLCFLEVRIVRPATVSSPNHFVIFPFLFVHSAKCKKWIQHAEWWSLVIGYSGMQTQDLNDISLPENYSLRFFMVKGTGLWEWSKQYNYITVNW